MQTTNYHSWTPEQKARFIIDALACGDIPQELAELIQGWMVSEDSEAAKDMELDRLLDQSFMRQGAPEGKTYRLLNELHERLGMPPVETPAPRRMSLNRRVWLRVAAVLIPAVVLIGAGLLLHDRSAESAQPVRIAYTKAQVAENTHTEITLPDGSRVRVAGGAELKYADDFVNNRSVKLSGEAFFSVERMEDNPFTVEAGDITVTVLGTEFGVRAHGGATSEVSLISGSVEVRAGGRNVLLAPMEEFILDNLSGGVTVRRIEPVAADTWKGLKLPLDNLPVGEALRKVAEYYGMTLGIEDGFSSDRHVRTIIDREDSPDDVMRVIQSIEPSLGYTIHGDTLTVSKR